MRRILFLLVIASVSLGTYAQEDSIRLVMLNAGPEVEHQHTFKLEPVFQYMKGHNIFQHLDLSLSAGTTGVGFDVASQISDWVQLRAGYEYMPRFKKTMKFDMTIKGQPVRRYDENGNRVETTFDKLKEFLYQMTGYDVEDHADMVGKPTFNNARVMVDVFPFKRNRNWHVTAGFYWGPSKFAEAVNSTETMVSLLSVGMYNRMYEKAVNGQSLIDFSSFTDLKNVAFEVPQELETKFRSFGELGFAVGYYEHDMIDSKGVQHLAGERYIVEPGEDSMVRVEARSNAFKPYLGFGYGGRLSKNSDEWKISFDCGAMFWGGTPDLIVHDGVNLTRDVKDINGQIGDYVDIFKAFKAYPVINIRLTKRLF